jgi:ferrous iron transport protein A
LAEALFTLDQLAPGQSATVARVGGQGRIRRRIMDMGVTRGVQIKVLRAAPMGDPVEYRLRGYNLSLRRSEAQMIEVEAPCAAEEEPDTRRWWLSRGRGCKSCKPLP